MGALRWCAASRADDDGDTFASPVAFVLGCSQAGFVGYCVQANGIKFPCARLRIRTPQRRPTPTPAVDGCLRQVGAVRVDHRDVAAGSVGRAA
jgi:hypothetical protein